MFGRKTGVLAVMAATMLLFGGCGKEKTADNLAKDGNNSTNAGTTMENDVTQGGNNLERDSYGMRTDGYDDNGTTLGEDVRNAWDDVKEDVAEMGDGNLNHATAKNK